MNSSAWDKFRKQQATEREQLKRLVFGMHGLLAKCRTTAPTEIELSALAALLHSFYTGVENIFKRVAVELDGEPVRGDSWHRGGGADGVHGGLRLRVLWCRQKMARVP
jgi:hypothetical protein